MTELIEDGQEIEVDLIAVDAAPQKGGIFVCEAMDSTSVNFRETSDGYLVFEANFARAGTQEYLAREIGLVGNDVKNVYRPIESVFDKKSARSFSSRPITLSHPPELVTPENAKNYSVGWTGTKITRNGDMIRGSGIITDRAAIEKVKSGDAQQLSMGYTLTLDMKSGTTPEGVEYDAIQKNMRMNHLALVSRARGGSKLIIDSKRKEPSMADKQVTVTIDGALVKVDEQGAAAVQKLQLDAEKNKSDMADMVAKHASEKAVWDTEKAALDAKVDKLTSEKMDVDALDALIEERANLVADAAKVAPDFKVKGLSDAEIRKGVVSSILGDEVVADKSDDYITARFDGMVDAGECSSDPFKKQMRKSTNDGHDSAWGSAIFDSANIKMKGAK